MKILITDRDEAASELLAARLRQQGHDVVIVPDKAQATARLAGEEFSAVFFDPAPLNDAKQSIFAMRRAARSFPYITLTGKDMPLKDALISGANDMMPKPFDLTSVETRIETAQRLHRLLRQIGDEREDFPSAGGVISKSAFNQLFLAGIDRAARYAERSYILFIRLANFKQLQMTQGQAGATFMSARLATHLVNMRRQSDIIAQTGVAEYALLLQRPVFETEPMEASNRFAVALKDITDYSETDGIDVVIGIDLVELPTGALPVTHEFTVKTAAMPDVPRDRD